MKKIILLISLFGILHFSFADKGDIKETTGENYKCDKTDLENFGYESVIKVGTDYYVIAKLKDVEVISVMVMFMPFERPSDFILYKLDEKMNVKAVAHIPAEIEGKYVQSLSLKKFGDNICALFYFNNVKTRKQYLFAQQFNPENLQKAGETYKIAETTISNKEKRLKCLYRVKMNTDNSRMLIMADRAFITRSKKQIKNARSQKNHMFSYWLIDNNFKLLKGNRKATLGKGYTVIVDHAFDNEGNMCFLGMQSEKAVKPRDSRSVSSTEGTDRSRSGLVMKIIRPDNSDKELYFAQGKHFYSAMLKHNPKTGNVAVVGLIASGKYGTNGIFTQQVNLSSGEMLNEYSTKFGVDLVKSINSQKQGEKKDSKKKKRVKPGPANPDFIYRLVRIGECYFTEDNELVVVTQKLHTYKVTTRTKSGNTTTTTTTQYYVYGDIISFKIGGDGNIAGFGFVPHYDESTIDQWRDYSPLFTGKSLYLVSGLEACEVKLNNKSSQPETFNTPAFQGKKTIYATTIPISDNELLQVQSQNRKLSFSLLSVEKENE